MAMLGGTRGTTGNLADAERPPIDQLVSQFEELVSKISKEKKLRRAVVRSQLFCNTIVVLTEDSLYLACERSRGLPSSTYLDYKSQRFSAEQVLEAAVWEFGYEKPFVLKFPRRLLDMPPDQRKDELVELAEEWVEAEMQRVMAMSRIVRLEPIFGPASFLADPRLCFVIMPFAKDLDSIYHDIIKPSVESIGMVCRRSDEIRSNNAIVRDIWKSICEARLIIADLTHANPNVFYELGIAHTVGKQTILLSQESEKEFPFDVMHLRRIVYENTASGGQKLTKELKSTIETILKPTQIQLPEGNPS